MTPWGNQCSLISAFLSWNLWCRFISQRLFSHFCVYFVSFVRWRLSFKGPYADHILIPPGSTGSSVFFGFKWKPHIFLIANLKFRLQTPCSFGDMAENVKLIGIPINNFLCIYIIASSPGLHTLFLPLESKQEVTSGWNLTKYISEIKVNQLKV